MLFYEYFENWIQAYKVGNVRNVTLKKYYCSLNSLKNVAETEKIEDLNRITYQKIIDKYAETHEKTTVLDFHHHLKSCIADAIDEGVLEKDPTKRVVVKGCQPRINKKDKYLNQFESQCLIRTLELGDKINLDYLVFLLLKTGLRFSEAIALTPSDFNVNTQSLNVSKTWNYKEQGNFTLTKNASSVRDVTLDLLTFQKITNVIKEIPENEPIFLYNRHKKNIANSTINDFLEKKCKQADIPVIAAHSLRHTHASLLLANGVSIASVSKRLGHSNIATTQKVYLHIIKELENKDNALALSSMMNLGG